MRRKDDNSPTKQRILDGAQAIMLAKGYAGTSVDEVCRRSKVTKGNFFYHFKSKEDLGKQLMQRFGECMSDGFCCAADNAGQDPLDRIYAVIDFMIGQTQSPDFHGCLIGTFAQEAEAIGPKLRSVCGMSFEKGKERFAGDFEAARKKYAPRSKIDTGQLADFFISSMQGSFVLMKAKGGDRAIVRSNLAMMKSYLKLLFGR